MTHNSMEEKFRSAESFDAVCVNFCDPELFLFVGSFPNFNLFEDLGVHHPLVLFEIRSKWMTRKWIPRVITSWHRTGVKFGRVAVSELATASGVVYDSGDGQSGPEEGNAKEEGKSKHQHDTPGPERANPERAREEKTKADGNGTRPAEEGEDGSV